MLVILYGRFFDDERGYVVSDGIDAAALGTSDAGGVRLQLDFAAAGGADDAKRLDELLRDSQPETSLQ